MTKINKNIDPVGEIKEDELMEVTSVEDAAGGIASVTVAGPSAAVSILCPTTKCTVPNC